MLPSSAPRAAVLLYLLVLCAPYGWSADDCATGCTCQTAPRTHPPKVEANCSQLAMKSLPDNFPHHIVNLEASFNQIEVVTENFFGKVKLKLSKVNLSNNSIRAIDELAFAQLPDLWILNLTGNALERLHSDTFSSNLLLGYVILRGNNMNTDEPLFSASQVSRLDLSFNNIRELKEFTFIGLPNLRYLRLHNNQFRKLQKSWFRPLPKLERLYLEHNLLTHLDIDTFVYTPKLFELSLSWNKLIVPSHSPFLRLPNLEYLYLSGCDFGSIPELMFELSPRVRMLWLSSNRLKALSVDMFNYLESLNFLNACDNLLECSCDLKKVWEQCQYRQISADVNCNFAGTEGAEEGSAEGAGRCAGRWDVLGDLPCNVSAPTYLPHAEEEPVSVAQLAVYVSVSVVLLLCLLAAGVLFYWKFALRRTRRASSNSHNVAYADMMPLNDDREDTA